MGETVAECVAWHGAALDECEPRRLPMQPGPIIGRDWELEAIRLTLLRADVRLVTVWGPAGIGKTRLALAVAALPELMAEFDSVVFVDLAPVAEASGVIPAMMEALGIAPRPTPHGVADILWYLHSRRVLLVLDNLEHVADVAPELVPLLVNCPSLKILATSRAALRLRWEHAFPVAPLAVPRAPYPRDAETVGSYAGVALFVARARAVRPDFQLTDANAHVVGELCARLDGLPLALELAASRVKGLPLLVLLARLEEDRLQLLQAGAPDLPVRQQALGRALAWSYDLLGERQQALFRRLSVFVDGWTPQAAEAVCGQPGAPGDVLEELAALVEASLVCLEEAAGDAPRYTMLATVRDYALRLLSDSGEATETRRRHAAYYLARVDDAEHARAVVERSGGLDREHGNLQAALQWMIESELAREARQGSGALIGDQTGLDAARAALEHNLAICRAADDLVGACASAQALAAVDLSLADFRGARARLEEALGIAAEMDDQQTIATVIEGFAWLAARCGEAERGVCLKAAAERLRTAAGPTSPSPRLGQLEADLAQARHALGPEASAAALARGRTLGLNQVLQLCLDEEQPAAPAAARECPQAVLVNGCLEEFTRREREVIELAVRGWSNRQIAHRLVISERTAEGHIHNILGKLQLDSRSQLAAWGVRAGLIPTEEPDRGAPPPMAALRG